MKVCDDNLQILKSIEDTVVGHEGDGHEDVRNVAKVFPFNQFLKNAHKYDSQHGRISLQNRIAELMEPTESQTFLESELLEQLESEPHKSWNRPCLYNRVLGITNNIKSVAIRVRKKDPNTQRTIIRYSSLVHGTHVPYWSLSDSNRKQQITFESPLFVIANWSTRIANCSPFEYRVLLTHSHTQLANFLSFI